MAKRFVKSKLYNTWSGKTDKTPYKDSVIFVEDRKFIIEGNADGDGFIEFDGRSPVAGGGIVVSELAKDGSTYAGSFEIEHADTSSQASVTASGRKYITGVTLDEYGHVTKLTTGTETVTNTNTTYDLTTTASTSNGKINLVAGGSGSGTDTVTLTGSGATTVTSDAAGNITITSTDTNTKVTSVGNHYTPSGGTALAASLSGDTTIADGGKVITGVSVTKDAAGHITGFTATTGKIDYPTVPTLPNNFSLFGLNNGSQTTNLGPKTTAGTLTFEYAANDDITITGTQESSADITTLKFSHDASGVTAGSYGPSANADPQHDGTFTVPYFTVNSKGHITAASTKTITMPDAPGNGILTIQADGVSKGTFSANQSSNKTINITASDLGLTQVMKYIGKTTTTLSDGATTNPITIGSKQVTVTQGNVVIDSADKKEYIWNGSKWEEFGNEGNYKVVQTAVSDPTASGNTLNFIASISQDTNGVITPTKSTVPTAGASLGVVKTTSTVNTIDGLTPSPIVNGVVYYKDTNTAHSHNAGVGLTADGTGGTSGTTTYKAKLKSETAHTAASATPTNTANRQYAVGVDKDGYLSVNVPWVNNTYTVNNGKLSMQIAGTEKTEFTANQSTGATFNVPSATASDYGVIKVSSVNTSAVTVNSESTTAGRYYPVELNSDGKAIVNVPWTDSNTDTKVKNTASSDKVFILGQEQNTTAQAYTNASVYMQSGKLYSEGYEVINSDDWAWEVLA